MGKFIRGIFVLFSLVTFPHAWAQNSVDDNTAINAHYQQLINAFSQLDIDLIAPLYAEDACYLPEGQKKAIVIGKDKILDLHRKFFTKIRGKQARIEVDFRVIDRQITGTKATDVGYFLVRFHPSVASGESTSEFAGKFVSVLEKAKDNSWHLTVDSSHQAEPQLFFEAQPVDNLYYGKHFTPLTFEE